MTTRPYGRNTRLVLIRQRGQRGRVSYVGQNKQFNGFSIPRCPCF